MSVPKLLIIHTGGTFGMRFDHKGKQLTDFDLLILKEVIPELEQLGVHFSVEYMSRLIDSSDMDILYWQQLSGLIQNDYDLYDAFIILHGTDTMSYTASALSFMLQSLSKPVILTGALLPLGSVRNDARENLITAIEIAAKQVNGKPVVQEVAICFNNKLMRGNRSTKSDSNHFDSFSSPNYPLLAEVGTEIVFNTDHLLRQAGELEVYQEMNDQVAILKLFPGMNQYVVDSLIDSPVKGIVLESFGNGNVPTTTWFEQGILKLIEKDVLILNVSQCLTGDVLQGKYQASQFLHEVGVIDGKDLITEAAITKMMHALARDNSRELLSYSLVGEML